MKTHNNLFEKLCSLENLEDAYFKARKRKSVNPKIMEFEKHWRLNLIILSKELRSKTYCPQPLQKFVLRDPKTRVICVSAFRDRVVHHALVNILKPIFQPRFIYDSYASQQGKGTFLALKRLEFFIRKVSKNGKVVRDETNANVVEGFALKADIRKYFDTVNHKVLIEIVSKKIKDGVFFGLSK